MMDRIELRGLDTFLLAWLLLAVFFGAIAAFVWWLDGGRSQPLFPAQRVRAAPWRVMDVALAALVYIGLDYAASVLFGLRDPDRYLGAVLRAETHAEVAAGLPAGSYSGLVSAFRGLAAHALEAGEQARRQVWATAAARPLQCVALILLLTVVAGGRLYQLGITTHRWRRVLVAGYLVWLLVTPLAKVAFWLLLHFEVPQPHPVETVIRQAGTLRDWGLVLFTILLAAPLLEELIFRGFLQPILVHSPALSDLVLLATMLGIIVSGTAQVWDRGFLSTPWPIILLIGTGAGYLAFERIMGRWLPRPGAARAIYATSVLFAMLHVSSWPAPLPLFVLSLGLGYLAYRTQSLWGPVLVHSMFNLTTLLELWLSGPNKARLP
jgi:membrane protease YdiL (CAAX protease family)